MIVPSMVHDDYGKAAPVQEVMPPAIPDDLSPDALTVCVDRAAVEVEGIACHGESAPSHSFRELEVVGVRFVHCCYTGSDFTQTIFRDVIFEDCDLSNAVMERTGFTRCSFSGCKLMGASLFESSFEDVRFKDCTLSYSALTRSRWKHVDLIGCDLTGADMAEVTQRFMRVSECRIVDVSLFRTSLAGIDFTTSLLENVSFSDSMTEFYGAKLNVYQAASLARLLGVIVEG